MNKAVILSAGKSSRFFKPLYDKPKGLFEYRGECLIERQIRQLIEADIRDITIVIGYEKEQYFFLQEKYFVKLVINEDYASTGSLASLFKVLSPSSISNYFVCCADHWYDDNPFLGFSATRSVRMISYKENASSEFVVHKEPDGRLSNLRSGAKAGLCMCGFAYFTAEFIRKFAKLYNEEKQWLGVSSSHWEQFWGRYSDILPLYGIEAPEFFQEFDSLGELQRLDPGVLENLSNDITEKICSLLKCDLSEICDVVPLNRGFTNVSFSFRVGKDKYVYRYPGYSSNTLVNRDAEVTAQKVAIELGIDPSVIYIGEDGHKLSFFFETTGSFDYNDESHLSYCVQALKNFHAKAPHIKYEVNMLEQGDRLLKLASNTKGDLTSKYSKIRKILERLWYHTELDGWAKSLCHNDVYAVNWLVSGARLSLIDWEYAAMNDPINDLATFIVRDSLSDNQTAAVLNLYFGHQPCARELRHCYAIFAMCGWYWFCWSLFKDTLGEDGCFMLSSYQGLFKYAPKALSMYESTRECHKALGVRK